MWTKVVTDQFNVLSIVNPILAWGGGIVALIWLLIIGQWQIVLGGVLIMVLDTYFYSLVVFPIQLLLGGLAILLGKIHSSLAFVGGILGALFTNGFIVTWSLVFILASEYIALSYGLPVWPLILAGYTIATGLFTGMAQKEGKDLTVAALQGVALSQTSYILFTLFYILGLGSWLIMFAIVLVLIGIILQLMVSKEERANV